MTPEPLRYELPDPMPWRALAAPLAQAEDALARLDERLRTSPVREGWISRTHFTEGCAALWLEGELVHLEDLVLHDAGRNVSAPTHALIRAHAVLRARRRIAAEPADWALSGAGLAALRGDAAGGAGPEQGRGRTAQSDATGGGAQGDDADGDGFDHGPISDDGEGASDGLDSEFAAVDALIARSRRVIDGEAAAPRPRNSLVYDLDWNEDERLQAWRGVRDQTRTLPPLLAGAFLSEAWEGIEPLQHRPWLGALLVAAALRALKKTKTHLLCLNAGLRLVARERRRTTDRTARLVAWGEAVAAAEAQAGVQADEMGLGFLDLAQRRGGKRLPSQARCCSGSIRSQASHRNAPASSGGRVRV